LVHRLACIDDGHIPGVHMDLALVDIKLLGVDGLELHRKMGEADL
jgi:hypothetical protein